MTNKEFKEIFKNNALDMSKEELEEIIEQELLKSDSLMDTDLIEYCIDLINNSEKENAQNTNDFKKEEKQNQTIIYVSSRIWKILASVSLCFVFMVSASAYFSGNIPEDVAKMFEGNFIENGFNNFNVELYDDFKNADTTAENYTLLNTDLAKKSRKQAFFPSPYRVF